MHKCLGVNTFLFDFFHYSFISFLIFSLISCFFLFLFFFLVGGRGGWVGGGVGPFVCCGRTIKKKYMCLFLLEFDSWLAGRCTLGSQGRMIEPVQQKKTFHFCSSPFHNSLPVSSLCVHWNTVGNYDTGCVSQLIFYFNMKYTPKKIQIQIMYDY